MPSPIERLREAFAGLNATDVADLLLSPFVDPELLRQATIETGPALWIVNRSDVYNESLEAISSHSWTEMAERAAAKLKARRGESLSLLEPYVLEEPVEQIPDYAVEDVLGHPLAPFEAMLFFSKAISEDVRASSALSLTRRLLEHPPNWDFEPQLRARLIDRFAYNLVEDHSAYVRAYTARVPILPPSAIEAALRRESSAFVLGRLCQNPAFESSLIPLALERLFGLTEDATFVARVVAADRRLNREQSSALAERFAHDEIVTSLREAYSRPH